MKPIKAVRGSTIFHRVPQGMTSDEISLLEYGIISFGYLINSDKPVREATWQELANEIEKSYSFEDARIMLIHQAMIKAHSLS